MDMERSNARATAPIPEALAAAKQHILMRSPLAALPHDEREVLLDLATIEHFPKRHAIATQGEPARSLLVLGAGRVKVERRSGDRLVALGHRGPGHVVGETALGGAAAATETVSVVDDVEALAFPLAPLRQKLAADAPLRAVLTEVVAKQHHELEQRLMGLLLYGVESRLASFLLDAAARWGVVHADGTLVTAPFTHAEIAQVIGSTRETVTLVLGKMKREGLLAFDRRRVVIRDRSQLAARVAEPAG